MAMKKIGDAQKIDIAYFGEEAVIVNKHLQKVGKSVSEFSAEEKKSLQEDLNAFRATTDKEENNESKSDSN